MVFITNGSMTTNSTMGDNDHPAVLNRDTEDMGLFTVWKNLADKDPKFGNPDKFIQHLTKPAG